MDGNGDCSSRRRRQAIQRRIGLTIRELRREKGWSRDDLAARLGVPRHSLAKWELGIHGPPLDDLKRLREVLGVSFEELILGHRAPAPPLPPRLRNELAMCINRLVELMRPLLQSPERKKERE